MLGKTWALAAYLVAASAAGCSDGPPEGEAVGGGAAGLFNLTVQVRNVELLPIGEARVQLTPGDRSVASGPLGDVRVSDVAPGRYDVTAAKDGFYPKTENVTVGRQDATIRVVLAQIPAPEARYALAEGGGYCMVVDGDQDPPACVNLLLADDPVAVINISAQDLDWLGVAFVWEATTDATSRFRFDVAANVSGNDWRHQDVVEGASGMTWTYQADDLPPASENDTFRVTFTPYPVDAPPGPTWADQHYRIEWVARFLPTEG